MRQLDDAIGIRGEVTLYLVRGELDDASVAAVLAGRRRAERIVRANLVTDVGRQEIVKRITDQVGITSPTHIAVGNVVYVPAVADTLPTGEFFRKACSSVAPYQSYFGRYVANLLTTEGNGAIKGVFLLTAAAGGKLWCEATTDLTKLNTQSLVIEWKLEARRVS